MQVSLVSGPNIQNSVVLGRSFSVTRKRRALPLNCEWTTEPYPA